jgi:hypothetical protein
MREWPGIILAPGEQAFAQAKISSERVVFELAENASVAAHSERFRLPANRVVIQFRIGSNWIDFPSVSFH